MKFRLFICQGPVPELQRDRLLEQPRLEGESLNRASRETGLAVSHAWSLSTATRREGRNAAVDRIRWP
ncbi:hypothetical protein CC2G_005153 [Coprinopsis cinerea AmutBmut pab1-1]|nr:hypothetical protein CC2G_005153 [Coprinopsis cinerea AmutBmut pab1-1]